MKLLCLLIVMNLSLFTQIQTANDWRFIGMWAVSFDTVYTRNYLTPTGQVFAQRGETLSGYAWRIQADWVKNFFINPVQIPDTLVFEIRVLETENLTRIVLCPAFQDSLFFTGIFGKSIPMDTNCWIRVTFDVTEVKIYLTEFRKIYLSIQLQSNEPNMISAKIEFRKMSGIYGTEEVVIDFTPTSILDSDPKNISFILRQNYPNPFNELTAINFSLIEESFVDLKVYDILGREIKIIKDEKMERGDHKAYFDGKGLPSGTYIYRLTVNGRNFITKKMILMK